MRPLRMLVPVWYGGMQVMRVWLCQANPPPLLCPPVPPSCALVQWGYSNRVVDLAIYMSKNA
jgi:hypothetical protein